MANHSVNLQDSFLNQVRKEGTEVEVALVNGQTHKGTVRGFDNFTVVLCVTGKQHLVYKHAIAQIITTKAPHPQAHSQAHPQPHAQAEQRPAGEEPPRSAKPRKKTSAPRQKTELKFNAIDLSHIKIEEPAGGVEAPREAIHETSSGEKAG